MNNCVKALYQSDKAFLYLRSKFSDLSDDIVIKQGIFVSQKTRKVMFGKNFQKKLKPAELTVWKEIFQLFGLLPSAQRKGGKLPVNDTKSVTEQPEVRMPDIIENPLVTLTPHTFS
jgi:hypothetical protein